MSLPHGGGPLQGDTRHQIIASLFNRRGEDGVLDETYIAHLKIWEDPPPSQAQHLPQGNAEDGGAKSRYLLLAGERGRLSLAMRSQRAATHDNNVLPRRLPHSHSTWQGSAAQSEAEYQHDILQG
jgi:hypothetical protein